MTPRRDGAFCFLGLHLLSIVIGGTMYSCTHKTNNSMNSENQNNNTNNKNNTQTNKNNNAKLQHFNCQTHFWSGAFITGPADARANGHETYLFDLPGPSVAQVGSRQNIVGIARILG